MTKEKISSQEIIDLVASKALVSKRAAEEFLKVMIATIEEALMAGEVVKIKGFGTFKLQWNEPRKSVNVQTGEEIILEGYHKVTFTPDTTLKEIVNEPFAHLEPVLLDGDNNFVLPKEDDEEPLDPLRIFTEQATEIKDLLSEIQALSVREIPASVNETEETPVNDYVFEEDEEDADDLGIQLDLSEAVEAFEAIQASSKQAVTIEEESVEVSVVTEFHSSFSAQETVSETVSEPDTEPVQIPVPEVEPIPETTVPEIEVPEIQSPVEEVKGDEPAEEPAYSYAMPSFTQSATSEQAFEFDSTPYLKGMETKKKSRKWLWISLSVVAVLLLAGVGLFMFYMPVHESGDKLMGKAAGEVNYAKEHVTIPDMVNSVATWFKPKPKETPKPETVVVPKDTTTTDTVKAKAKVKSKVIVKPKEKVDSLQLMFDNPRVYEEFIAAEQIKPGSRLTVMSEKYYGTKDFWVYIYEANKEKIPDPDKIQMGTLIRIPKLDARLIDASNPRCMQKARELHDKYVKRKEDKSNQSGIK